jgi:hypothetical protein
MTIAHDAPIERAGVEQGPDPAILEVTEAAGSPISLVPVSARLDPSWSVLASPSTPAVDRCVDIFVRSDGTFGFEEFRRDPEDMGVWTPVAYYSTREFETESDALSAARDAVPWLPAVLDGNS